MWFTDKLKKELSRLFPDESVGLIERGDYDEIVDFLDEEVVAAFDENDDPTPESNRIERLMDSIIWNYLHPDDPVE